MVELRQLMIDRIDKILLKYQLKIEWAKSLEDLTAEELVSVFEFIVIQSAIATIAQCETEEAKAKLDIIVKEIEIETSTSDNATSTLEVEETESSKVEEPKS